MKNCLVTGGFGFLGSYLVRELIGKGENVVVLDIQFNDILLQDQEGKYSYEVGSLCDWNLLLDVFEKYSIDQVYHLASMVVPRTEGNLMQAFDNNVGGTLNLLEISRIKGVDSFLYGSSTGVYGERLPYPKKVGEDAPQFPWHMYGTTKVCCERLGEQFQRKYDFNFRGLRLPPIFGIARRSKGSTAFCDSMLRELLNGREYELYVADDTPVTSAMSVQDAVKAILDLQDADEGNMTRRIYNIDSFSFTTAELVTAILDRLTDVRINRNPNREISESLKLWPVPDCSRAKSDWGWTPRHQNVEQYVEQGIEEYKACPERFV